jgi:hypothetical protein
VSRTEVSIGKDRSGQVKTATGELIVGSPLRAVQILVRLHFLKALSLASLQVLRGAKSRNELLQFLRSAFADKRGVVVGFMLVENLKGGLKVQKLVYLVKA